MGQKIYLYTINPLYINSYSILVDFYMPLISNQAISLYYYLENKAKENIKVLEMENIISETKFDSTKILMIRKLFPIMYYTTATTCKNNIMGMYYMLSLLNPNILGQLQWFRSRYLKISIFSHHKV